MKLKTILILVGAAVLLFIIYKVLFSNHAGSNKGAAIQAFVPKALEPVKTATPEVPKELSKDQKLIQDFTAKIEAKQLEGGNVYYQRGLVYIRTKQYREAIQDFDAAMRLVPNSPPLYYNRGLANFALKDYDKALEDLAQAIKLKPDYMDAFNTRGLVYVEKQDYNAAVADYDQAIKLDDKLPETYYNLGTLYIRMQKYPEAKEAFTQAINKSTAPANATPEQLADMQTKLMQAYLSLARVEYDLGEFENALKDATYVVDNDPHNIDALRTRANIYDKLGNSAAAANDVATADNMSMQKMLDTKQ